VEADGSYANNLLGFEEPPRTDLVFGFRADLGSWSIGIALRDHIGEVVDWESVPWRLDVFSRF
jgi:hypothetical protein